MFFDHLSLAGILVVSFYGLLPFLFGKEFFRVDAEDERRPEATASRFPDDALRQQELSDSYSDC
jgi:hypothetical protein